MTCSRHSLGLVAAFTASLGAAILTGCSDSGTADGENGGAPTTSGGSTGSGGVAGSSGRTGSGGVAGSGGRASTGGVTSSGGSGTGGVTSSGGSSATGGSTGSSGRASTGGVTGSGGLASTGGATGGGSTGTGGSSGGGISGSAGLAGTGGANGGSSGGGGTGGAASNCPPATPLTGGTRYCSNARGNVGSYGYERWAEGGGSGCMTVYGKSATFGATWTDVEDFLARVGLDFDRTRTPAEIGILSADFAHTKTGSEDGLTYIGIYGWTVNPLREYYILDDWGTTKPAGVASDGTPRTSVGTLTADGETYDVWMKTRTNKPAITGDNMTFDQYFSIRRSPRQCGHISISEHFSKWIEMGLQLGDLVEAKLLIEAQANSGTVEFTTASVSVD